jgi:hypothetical protein
MGWSKEGKRQRRDKRIKDRQAATEETAARIAQQKSANKMEHSLRPATRGPD